MEHPFTFSSFKIKSLEQIETIQSLGLTRIRYSPEKSDCAALSAPAATAPPPPPPPPLTEREHDPMYRAKRARIERLVAQRARLTACEREFLSSARAVKAINENLFSRPDESRLEAARLVQTMADSMLTDTEIAINLMKDKIGNEEVYHHSLNVTLLSLMLAKELKAPPEAIHLLGLGAMFHDIGKVEIPDRVARKTEPLTKPEVALMRQHCAYGFEIGRKLSLAPESLAVIAQHHEHVDGSGYPKALHGPQISLLAKIVAIANTYDNLCNPANPAKALTPHEALSTMYAQQRAMFETVPLNTFVRCMGVYPPGTIVVLSNDSVGMVVSVNSARPLKPTVLIYDPAVPKEEAILAELEQEPDVTISRTMKPQQLPAPVFEYLSPRKRIAYYFDSETANAAG
jgi:putative nucleotidyltransferase with HDIG domain